MTLLHIAVFALGSLLYAVLFPTGSRRANGRGWVLLIVSVVAIYWLQPALPIRNLDFALPTVTLALTVFVWLATRQGDFQRQDLYTLLLIVALVLVLSATRYLIPELRPTPSRPPDILPVALALLVFGVIAFAAARFLPRGPQLALAALVIITLFVVIKANPLATGVSGWLRAQTGQDVTLAGPIDLGWLGFSYVAFRLLHMLRDRQTGKLPALSLREHLTYVIFFPAYTAGPIDRAERFVKDDRALPETPLLTAPRIALGGGRIALGLFKKFVIADSLALLALNAANAEQATSTFGLWLMLYTYAFRLYFDFSGYTDIALGVGILYGVTLPENFDRPYLKPNLTAFWQSWHITLGNWARFYVFSPFSRWLLTRPRKPSPLMIVLLAQLATMIVIGLWHGFTLTFLLWGIWHALGLFAHKVWTDRTRKWYAGLKDRPRRKQAWTIAGMLLTFHFVLLGWVWFALPDAGLAARTFLRLFGLG